MLYCNPLDLTNAVMFDRDWLRDAVARNLRIVRALAPPFAASTLGLVLRE